MRALGSIAMSLTLVLGACAGDTGAGRAGSGTTLVTSFYPLAWVAEKVGGDEVTVVDLTPPGVEPHDLELTTSQAVELNEADLIVYLGGGFQPSIEDALKDVDAPTVDVLEHVRKLEGSSDEEHEDESEHGDEGHDDDHVAEGGGIDPHVWLDPRNMQEIAAVIAEQLAEADPDNADVYESDADEVVAELDELDREMADGLDACERREIVVSHEAFGYLTGAYDLEQVGISGLDPESEPSPARIAEVEKFAREHGVTTIFFEELVSPDTAETLASELDIETSVLSPLETAPSDGDYLDAMRANLEALRDALGCD